MTEPSESTQARVNAALDKMREIAAAESMKMVRNTDDTGWVFVPLSESIYDLWLQVNDAERTWNERVVPWSEWSKRVRWESSGKDSDGVCDLYRGATTLDGFELNGPRGFDEVESFCDYPYRIVWASRTERVILTYCEGDLNYQQAPDDAAFRSAWLSAARFYGALGL